jgi:hypothetical protein
MKLSVQVSIHPDDESGEAMVSREVLSTDRDELAPATLGLQLAEAKELLSGVQDTLVEAQALRAVAGQVPCPDCGRDRRHKDIRTITVASLFGKLRLPSPRWWHCDCRPHPTRTFQPLAELLPDRITPELAYQQSRFAGLVSYGASVNLLGELLPLGRRLHATVLRRQVQSIAGRLEDELGDERVSFIETCPRDWEALPHPDLPLVVGLDGGYVHSSEQRSRKDGWFEVIAGKAIPNQGRPTCFGYVQTYDAKPKRRLYEVLKSQGMQDNQQLVCLTDGGEDIRDLPCFLNPQAEHYLDWFHITMRITVMTNMAKSLRPPPPDDDIPDDTDDAPRFDPANEIGSELERCKWFLWHGNLYRALQSVSIITMDTEIAHPGPEQVKMAKAIGEFNSYIRANAGRIPNYGERRRAGEAISTAFVESTVNQVVSKRMVKKQQMRWSPRGAHLLLQVRTRVLNDQLADDFHRWHPGFDQRRDELTLAA